MERRVMVSVGKCMRIDVATLVNILFAKFVTTA